MSTGFTTLSGVVEDPDKVCDQVLMAVFASDFSQSNVFQGQVSSFQHLVHICGTNWPQLKSSMEKMFTSIFQRFFDVVDMNVSVTGVPDQASKMKITLSGTVTNGQGKRYDLASQVQVADGLVNKILVGERLLWAN